MAGKSEQYPWNQFAIYSKKPNTRKAKKGDKLIVIKRINTCCCNEGDEVLVAHVSLRGDLTTRCPVFGKHEHGFAYNHNFRFVEEKNDNGKR